MGSISTVVSRAVRAMKHPLETDRGSQVERFISGGASAATQESVPEREARQAQAAATFQEGQIQASIDETKKKAAAIEQLRRQKTTGRSSTILTAELGRAPGQRKRLLGA